jgi:hypothetical protein
LQLPVWEGLLDLRQLWSAVARYRFGSHPGFPGNPGTTGPVGYFQTGAATTKETAKAVPSYRTPKATPISAIIFSMPYIDLQSALVNAPSYPDSPFPIFFETSPRRHAFMGLRLLTVKFRCYNQRTKFRVKDGTQVSNPFGFEAFDQFSQGKKGANLCVIRFWLA